MGQAKKRGSFEQRQARAIEREAERKERERIELAVRKERQRVHDLAHPQQAAARRKRSLHTAMLMSVILGASASIVGAAPVTSKGPTNG